jgi:hypothetical protein
MRQSSAFPAVEILPSSFTCPPGTKWRGWPRGSSVRGGGASLAGLHALASSRRTERIAAFADVGYTCGGSSPRRRRRSQVGRRGQLSSHSRRINSLATETGSPTSLANPTRDRLLLRRSRRPISSLSVVIRRETGPSRTPVISTTRPSGVNAPSYSPSSTSMDSIQPAASSSCGNAITSPSRSKTRTASRCSCIVQSWRRWTTARRSTRLLIVLSANFPLGGSSGRLG